MDTIYFSHVLCMCVKTKNFMHNLWGKFQLTTFILILWETIKIKEVLQWVFNCDAFYSVSATQFYNECCTVV
jgi:hypothetical protein